MLRHALAACLLALPSLAYDAPVPATVRVCVQAYPPFVLTRDWQGKSIDDLLFPAGFGEPASMSGVSFFGANSSLIDGFDVAFAKLVFQEYLGSQVKFMPYPDTISMYVGLRNGDCDAAMSAIELTGSRATCTPKCPDTRVSPLPVYDGSDYATPAYAGRMAEVCCLEYSIPYLPKSGFAIFSLATRGKVLLADAILSIGVLNASTPVLIAIVGFGWVMWLLERRLNKDQFPTPSAGVYFGFVAMATFGFGDLAPVTRTGRVLTVFITMMSVLALSAITSVVSATLTLSRLAFAPITTFAQLKPSEICVESSYELARDLISSSYSIPSDQLEAAGLQFGTIADCGAAVLSGAKKAYTSDKPMLDWLATSYYGTGNIYVSDVLRGNPLSIAFPAGSSLRPRVDTAVINMLTNYSWSPSHDALMNSWFPVSTANAPIETEPLNVPMFVAAVVLLGTTLLIAGVQGALEERHIARAAKKFVDSATVHLHGHHVQADKPGSLLTTGTLRFEAAAVAATGARDAARAAASAAAVADALASEVEALAAALDAAQYGTHDHEDDGLETHRTTKMDL